MTTGGVAVLKGYGGDFISHVFPVARITEPFQEAEWKERGADGLRLSRAALSMVD